jgi:hypothetical protein
VVSGLSQGALRGEGVLQVDDASTVHLGKPAVNGMAP